MGHRTQAYQGTLMSVGGSNPGGYVGGVCGSSDSYIYWMVPVPGAPLKAKLPVLAGPLLGRAGGELRQRRGVLRGRAHRLPGASDVEPVGRQPTLVIVAVDVALPAIRQERDDRSLLALRAHALCDVQGGDEVGP